MAAAVATATASTRPGGSETDRCDVSHAAAASAGADDEGRWSINGETVPLSLLMRANARRLPSWHRGPTATTTTTTPHLPTGTFRVIDADPVATARAAIARTAATAGSRGAAATVPAGAKDSTLRRHAGLEQLERRGYAAHPDLVRDDLGRGAEHARCRGGHGGGHTAVLGDEATGRRRATASEHVAQAGAARRGRARRGWRTSSGARSASRRAHSPVSRRRWRPRTTPGRSRVASRAVGAARAMRSRSTLRVTTRRASSASSRRSTGSYRLARRSSQGATSGRGLGRRPTATRRPPARPFEQLTARQPRLPRSSRMSTLWRRRPLTPILVALRAHRVVHDWQLRAPLRQERSPRAQPRATDPAV